MIWWPFISPIADVVGKAVDRIFPDKTEAAKVKAEVARDLMTNGQTLFTEASKTIRAEAQSESWLARSWRPITMLTFVFIIANNYIIAPYAAAFGHPVPTLDLPPNMWSLIQIGLGGYVVGRSAEKAIKYWKDKE